MNLQCVRACQTQAADTARGPGPLKSSETAAAAAVASAQRSGRRLADGLSTPDAHSTPAAWAGHAPC